MPRTGHCSGPGLPRHGSYLEAGLQPLLHSLQIETEIHCHVYNLLIHRYCLSHQKVDVKLKIVKLTLLLVRSGNPLLNLHSKSVSRSLKYFNSCFMNECCNDVCPERMEWRSKGLEASYTRSDPTSVNSFFLNLLAAR